MTSKDVRAIVLGQIGNQWSRSNMHGCDLRECLVDPPEKLALVKATDETDTEGWLVLREDPAGGPGYGVVFHEESNEFGLTQFAEGYAPCLIGLYGQFFDAFDAIVRDALPNNAPELTAGERGRSALGVRRLAYAKLPPAICPGRLWAAPSARHVSPAEYCWTEHCRDRLL